MKLPTNFQFSQTNLQDFEDCRRKFYLKHLLHLSWPAIETEPIIESERSIELGLSFHHLLHQFLLGIPANELRIQEQDQEIGAWWQQFQTAIVDGGNLHSAWLPTTYRYPEITIVDHLRGVPLVAKLDLIAVQSNGSLQIFDWKTSHNAPRRDWMTTRLQTIVYPYLLVKAGTFLNNGEPISPDQVEMNYWYPLEPDILISIPYNQKQYQADHIYLEALADTILRITEDEFILTLIEHRCKYCTYRSLCDRGISAGQLAEYQANLETGEDDYFEIDFTQIDEVSF
jgi:hypothetical protein